MITIEHNTVLNRRPESFTVSPLLVKKIIGLIRFVGHDKMIPTKMDKISTFGHSFIQAVVVNNISFPFDLPIDFVMRQWILAITNDADYMPNANLASFSQSLSKFIRNTTPESLRMLYFAQKPPSDVSKQLKAINPLAKEEIEAKKLKALQAIKDLEGEGWQQSKLYQATLNLFEGK